MSNTSGGLTALPNDELIAYINGTMRSKFNRIALVGSVPYNDKKLISLLETTANLRYNDLKKYIFDEYEAEVTYFDESGVFTVVADISNEKNYSKHIYAVLLLSEDKTIATVAKSPIMYLSAKIGAQFPIKIPINGNNGEVVFRASKYLTLVELEELHILPSWYGRLLLHEKIIQAELIALDEKKINKNYFELIFYKFELLEEESKSRFNNATACLYSSIQQNRASIIEAELKQI